MSKYFVDAESFESTKKLFSFLKKQFTYLYGEWAHVNSDKAVVSVNTKITNASGDVVILFRDFCEVEERVRCYGEGSLSIRACKAEAEKRIHSEKCREESKKNDIERINSGVEEWNQKVIDLNKESIGGVPLSAEGQLKRGDTLRIYGKSESDNQVVTVKDVLKIGENEEVLIDREKNRYFITKCVLSGTSWVKCVVVVQ